jgi:hypothetical protein
MANLSVGALNIPRLQLLLEPLNCRDAAVCDTAWSAVKGGVGVALAAHPLAALHEPLVLNLCSLYELAAADAAAAKRRIADWLQRAGPEDFDSTGSTRLA